MQPSSCTIQVEHDDVIVVNGPRAVAQLAAAIDAAQAGNKALLNRMTQEQRQELERELVKRATPTPEMAKATEAARVAWRAQRVIVGKTEMSASRPTARRPRGAGRPAVRSAAQRSSARSGDSGDDEGSEPPARGRRLNSRQELDEWVAERRQVLGALICGEQLRLDGEVGS